MNKRAQMARYLVLCWILGCSSSISSAQTLDTAGLRATLAAVDQQISEARQALVAPAAVGISANTIALLEHTRALVQQRLLAATYAVDMRYTVNGSPLSLPPADSATLRLVTAELGGIDEQISSVRPKASQDEISALTLSTLLNTRANVAHRQAVLMFQLPDFASIDPPASVAQTTAAAERLERAAAALKQAQLEAESRLQQLREDQRLQQQLWQVQSVDYRVTEVNSVFARFAWKVTVWNGGTAVRRFDLEIQFLDKGGFVVDRAYQFGQVIGPMDVKTITGDDLVRMPGAQTVASVKAMATPKP
jgi:hypothetical protein